MCGFAISQKRLDPLVKEFACEETSSYEPS